MITFRVKNFEKFQHYKDRSPPWIKLYNELLDDYDFGRLDDASKAHMILIWLLASRSDNKIPWDAEWIGRKIGSQSPVDLEFLKDSGFIVVDSDQPDKPDLEWGSRYIAREVKEAVWERDGGKCCACRTASLIEYDHIVPVSRGGSSDIDNIQLLCRSCNRKKRVRSDSYVAAEQVATHTSLSAESRDRGETEGEREKISSGGAAEEFENWYLAFPRHEGKGHAAKAYRKARKTKSAAFLLEHARKAAAKYAATEPNFIPMPATWLNGERWADQQAPPRLIRVESDPLYRTVDY
jgi:hypothetical protein